MSIYRIKMNGKTYEMEVDLIEEGKPKKSQSVQKNREYVKKETAVEEQSTVENTVSVNANVVVAPMPGNIIQLISQMGDEVSANDPVLILEAMKMENEICSFKPGRIKSIYVKEGQHVSSGDPLFEMED